MTVFRLFWKQPTSGRFGFAARNISYLSERLPGSCFVFVVGEAQVLHSFKTFDRPLVELSIEACIAEVEYVAGLFGLLSK